MPKSDDFDPLANARRILRTARSGSLATVCKGTGAPFASRVIVACDVDGAPLLLLSDLAVHTQNLKYGPRASLLLCAEEIRDPMQDARVSINGRAVASPQKQTRRRFLARHPEAADYADFADFAFYRLDVDDAHLVAGFGRIHTITSDTLLLDLAGASELIAAEASIVEHMNTEHKDALALYATNLLGGAEGDWAMSGCDPEGIDLVSEIGTRRLVFDNPASDPQSMRAHLVALAETARSR